ncbi:MAG: AMP-binding protein [Leptospiraceae bacterium]|nr:AMP-binding protein [Leptospiraceae bacterium]
MEKESLYHLVRDTVATYAERPVYWVKPDGKSFGAISFFNWRADMKRFSAFLLYKLGIKHGEAVGLLSDNRYEWNLICMGIDTIGAVDVPRGCDATPDDIRYILNHTECSTVVVEHEKMLKVLLSILPDLPHIKHIISITGADKHKKLEDNRKALGDIQLHFFIDILGEGEELLDQHGEELLKKRGEAIKPHDLATIIYTSGTTGAPKGVMLEHRCFCWEVSQVQQTVPINERDRVVVFLPPWHIAERVLEVTLVACGASMAPSNIISLASDLKTIQPTMLLSVPRVWEGLYNKVLDGVRKQPENKQKIFNFAINTAMTYTDLVDTLLNRIAQTKDESPRDRLTRKLIAAALLPVFVILNFPAQLILKKVREVLGGRIRFAVSGAGAIPEKVARFFRASRIAIMDVYGMTETTAASVAAELPWPKRNAVGRPLPGVQIQIRDDSGKVITKPGVKGVLWHKGPHIMRGYYKEPEKTAQVLQDGWLNSGDIFVWTYTGELAFAGRAKDTIVLAGGENVEPEPIEMKLKEHDAVAQAVVVGQDRKTLAALIVPNWDSVAEKLQADGISAPDDKWKWNDTPEIHKYFQQIVKTSISNTTGFKAFEKLSGFYLLGKELEKGVEMTETMKVKRNVVFEKFEKEINSLYRD